MADLPIPYAAPMVRALILDLKEQTRRTFKKLRRFGPIHNFDVSDTPGYDWHFRDRAGRFHDLRNAELLQYLPYQVGDRLYVREAWRTDMLLDALAPRLISKPVNIKFEADGLLCGSEKTWVGPGKLRQGMHMPKWVSRITLIVEDVKVERLQDISETDAVAEGCFKGKASGRVFNSAAAMHLGGDEWSNARDWYADLWETINGTGAWDKNPWVIAYKFRTIMGNIDQVAA